jgi:hypothetical protein
MKQFILSSLVLIGLSSTAQTSQQKREIAPFTKLEVSGATSVFFTPGDSSSLTVMAGESEIKHVQTTVENGVLGIQSKGAFRSTVKVYVTGPSLKEITATGASKVSIADTLKAETLEINVTGASSVKGPVKTGTVNVSASGASVVELTGSTKASQNTITGASSLKAYDLLSENTRITTSGASSAKVYASQKITADATGSSSVKFKGNPEDVSAEASTSSSIARVVDESVSKNNNDSKDSTTINLRKKKFIIIDKDLDIDTHRSGDDDDFHNWAGFGIGVNGWTTPGGNFNLPKSQKYMELDYGKSLNFQLNPLEKDIHIYKNYINLVVGLGFEWSQYQFSNKTTLNPDSSYTFGTIDSSNFYNYKKNRFKTTFVNVPLLLEFNTNKNPDKAFHVAFGVIGGYRLGSRTRQVLEDDGLDLKLVRKDSYNMNPFRLNAHASVGYRNFTLYADYAMTPLFVNGKGPELYPFTFGVKLISF